MFVGAKAIMGPKEIVKKPKSYEIGGPNLNFTKMGLKQSSVGGGQNNPYPDPYTTTYMHRYYRGSNVIMYYHSFKKLVQNIWFNYSL